MVTYVCIFNVCGVTYIVGYVVCSCVCMWVHGVYGVCILGDVRDSVCTFGNRQAI